MAALCVVRVSGGAKHHLAWRWRDNTPNTSYRVVLPRYAEVEFAPFCALLQRVAQPQPGRSLHASRQLFDSVSVSAKPNSQHWDVFSPVTNLANTPSPEISSAGLNTSTTRSSLRYHFLCPASSSVMLKKKPCKDNVETIRPLSPKLRPQSCEGFFVVTVTEPCRFID